MKYIVLDSAPLSTVTRRDDVPGVKECLEWLMAKAAAGIYPDLN